MRAGYGCTSRNSWKRGRGEAEKPPPDLELDHSYSLGPDGPCNFGPAHLFREWRGQSLASAADGKPSGKSDRRESGIASDVDSLARHAFNHNWPGNSRKRAGRHRASVHGG